MKKKILEYNAIFQKANEGGYSVWIPTLPGCAYEYDTFEEAISLYLDDEKYNQQEQGNSRSQFMAPSMLAT